MNSNLHLNLVTIASFLDLKDLISLCSTCKSYCSLLKLELIWSNLIHSSGFISPAILEEKPNDQSCYTYFQETFGKYKIIKDHVYRILQKLHYDNYFTQSKPLVSLSTPNKTKVNYLNQIIKNSYGSIPVSYFILYYILNGQNALDGINEQYESSSPKAFFGGFSYYFEFYEFYFLPLESYLCGFLKNFKFHPFAKENHNFYIFNDFGNFLGFGAETLFSIVAKKNTLNGLVYTLYLVNETLIGFLKEISSLPFENDPEKSYLDHFDTLNNPCSDVTTHGIRVRARAIFNPWDQRAPNKNFFPYQIRISDNGVQKPFRLISRKWIILDGEKVEEVEGEGVIGKFPVISHGCEDFIYESMSVIDSFQGSMEGHLIFESIDDHHERITVIVGKFLFKIREGSKILKVSLEKKEILEVFS